MNERGRKLFQRVLKQETNTLLARNNFSDIYGSRMKPWYWCTPSQSSSTSTNTDTPEEQFIVMLRELGKKHRRYS